VEPKNFLTATIDAGQVYGNIEDFTTNTLRATPSSCKLRTNPFAFGALTCPRPAEYSRVIEKLLLQRVKR
jgi:hypothetical protein